MGNSTSQPPKRQQISLLNLLLTQAVYQRFQLYLPIRGTEQAKKQFKAREIQLFEEIIADLQNRMIEKKQFEGFFFLKKETKNLSAQLIKEKINSKAQVKVEIYSRKLKDYSFLKHHGIILTSESWKGYWCIQFFEQGLYLYQGQEKQGTLQHRCKEELTLKSVMKAAHQSSKKDEYSVAFNNCNDYVRRFCKGIGSKYYVSSFS